MALLRYTLLRLLMLAVAGALLWLLGVRGFWLLLVAVFVSGVISIFVLSRSRDQVSAALHDRVGTINRRLQERAAAEDAWDQERRDEQWRTETGAETGTGTEGDTSPEPADSPSSERAGSAQD